MEILCYGTVPTFMFLNIMKYYITIMTFIYTILLPITVKYYLRCDLCVSMGRWSSTKDKNYKYKAGYNRKMIYFIIYL